MVMDSTTIALFTVAYDANGNTLSDASGKGYTWDFENRLTQAVVPGTNGGTTTFKYDPFGRRIYKSSDCINLQPGDLYHIHAEGFDVYSFLETAFGNGE
jgi:YD repeat-containing protein